MLHESYEAEETERPTAQNHGLNSKAKSHRHHRHHNHQHFSFQDEQHGNHPHKQQQALTGQNLQNVGPNQFYPVIPAQGFSVTQFGAAGPFCQYTSQSQTPHLPIHVLPNQINPNVSSQTGVREETGNGHGPQLQLLPSIQKQNHVQNAAAAQGLVSLSQSNSNLNAALASNPNLIQQQVQQIGRNDAANDKSAFVKDGQQHFLEKRGQSHDKPMLECKGGGGGEEKRKYMDDERDVNGNGSNGNKSQSSGSNNVNHGRDTEETNGTTDSNYNIAIDKHTTRNKMAAAAAQDAYFKYLQNFNYGSLPPQSQQMFGQIGLLNLPGQSYINNANPGQSYQNPNNMYMSMPIPMQQFQHQKHNFSPKTGEIQSESEMTDQKPKRREISLTELHKNTNLSTSMSNSNLNNVGSLSHQPLNPNYGFTSSFWRSVDNMILNTAVGAYAGYARFDMNSGYISLDDIPWREISSHFPYFSPSDCRTQWTLLNPNSTLFRTPTGIVVKPGFMHGNNFGFNGQVPFSAASSQNKSRKGKKRSLDEEENTGTSSTSRHSDTLSSGNRNSEMRRRHKRMRIRNNKKTPWTSDEEKKIEEMQRLIGNKWTLIAAELPKENDRSGTDVKNYWHSNKHRILEGRAKATMQSLMNRNHDDMQNRGSSEQDSEKSKQPKDGTITGSVQSRDSNSVVVDIYAKEENL